MYTTVYRGNELIKTFKYKNRINGLLNNDILTFIANIYELKGQTEQYSLDKSNDYAALVENAKIRSIESSNRIEGISVSDKQIKNIALNKTYPKTKPEEEIAGYREVLKLVHENHDYINIESRYILQMHKELYQFSNNTNAGKLKMVDNEISEIKENGEKVVRFYPVPAFETEEMLLNLCDEYNKSIVDGLEPILVMSMFVLDFLCIHPFLDGNGRISRLLTLLMMYKNGFDIVKVVSIEKIIEDTKETYYESLFKSSEGFNEDKNNYTYFVRYLLGVIIKAYKDFLDEAKVLTNKEIKKVKKVEEVIKESLRPITKTEIYDTIKTRVRINQVTVQRALAELLESNKIIKIGGGRYTSYVWNNDYKEEKNK